MPRAKSGHHRAHAAGCVTHLGDQHKTQGALTEYSDEFRHRFQFKGTSVSDSNPPPFPLRFRHPLSMPVSDRVQRRVVHGGVRAALATNARPPRWATRVQRPECVLSPALYSFRPARPLSAMRRGAGHRVAVPYGSTRPAAARDGPLRMLLIRCTLTQAQPEIGRACSFSPC